MLKCPLYAEFRGHEEVEDGDAALGIEEGAYYKESCPGHRCDAFREEEGATGEETMKILPLILVICGSAFGQTYTVTQDGCGGKANQLCQLSTDHGPITIDNRAPSRIGYLDLGTFGQDEYHGAYSGFVQNPDGTHHPFYGVASYESDDQTVHGEFQFYAYYVGVCSGRGCGGTIGWHYRILTGSTVVR